MVDFESSIISCAKSGNLVAYAANLSHATQHNFSTVCCYTAAGAWLMQRENFSLWTLVESELRNRRVPTEEVLADLLLWGGGVLLIVPGFLTDALGLVIFIPAVRQESIQWLRKRMQESLGLPQLEK